MNVGDVFSFIDGFAPFDSQSSWDNSGILLGTPHSEVNRILVCLDLTVEAANYAAAQGCDMIVSHHPVIFRAVKSIPEYSVLRPLIRNDISVICAHTNLDKCAGGVNDTLCGLIFPAFEKCGEAVADGFLNVGRFDGSMRPADVACLLKERLGGAVRYMEGRNEVAKAAVCAGSGGEFYKEAAALGCDALITGDADHHDFLDAAALGISLFAAGHYETEYPIVNVLCDKLSIRFPDTQILEYPRMQTIITI